MTDLTKIEKPFGLLDKETREALLAHYGSGGAAEYYSISGVWVECDHQFFSGSTYRAKPLPLPEWPAGLLPKWRWMAMDENGYVYVYTDRPKCGAVDWAGTDYSRIDRLIPISFDGIPWEKAVIERPEDE